MRLIWDYLRNPATFWRRKTIGCLGGCLGTPIVLGLIVVLIFVIDRVKVNPWLVVILIVFVLFIFTTLSLAFLFYKTRVPNKKTRNR
jgi:hypothetical protein